MAIRLSTVQLKRGTKQRWQEQNPVLKDGEPGLEKDTKKFKAGDGTTAWNDLGYYGGGPEVSNEELGSAYTNEDAEKALSRTQGVKLKNAIPTIAAGNGIDILTTAGSDDRGNMTPPKITISATGGGGSPVTVENVLTSTSATNALSANQGRVLNAAIAGKAASSTVTSLSSTVSSLSTTVTNLNRTVTNLNTTVNGKASANYETWTFTLSSGSSIIKRVAIG